MRSLYHKAKVNIYRLYVFRFKRRNNILANILKDIQDKKRAIVVGSGIAGLASAIRLSNLGFKVDVFEQHATYGGKMGEWSQMGYRFDTGPSLFTMPHFVDELLAIDSDQNVPFAYQKLDVVCKYFWDDGTQLVAYGNQEKLVNEFEQVLGEPKENIKNFLAKSKEKYNITNHVFLERSLHRLSTFLRLSTLKSFLKLHKVEIFKTMNASNKEAFNNPKTIQFFNRYATYNGSNPYRAPATLNVIPHYEFGFGAFFPTDGIRSIADSLYQKAVKLGAKFHFNTPVTRVEKMDNGFLVNENLKSDIVFCNMDVAAASKGPFKNFLSPKRETYEASSSALIFYWGIKKQFPNLDVHNIFFSKDYQKEFHHLFDQQTLSDDLTIYVHISSKIKKDDAPEYGENWFVMVNAPAVEKQDWDELIPQVRKTIIQRLTQELGENIEDSIEVEQLLTPINIYQNTSSYKGALYGTSSNNRKAAFLRQPNFSKNTKGLYFCGGSVHPGGGIPLCLLSAKIATEKVKSDYNIH